MRNNPDQDSFFNDINFASTVETVKGIFTSDGAMSTLLDFERVLDEADLYAFQNWELGELVHGPIVKKYTVSCVFMWPYKLMPNPRGAKRLLQIGCKLKFKKTKIKIPVKVDSPDDFLSSTHYPKSKMKPVWLIYIQIPSELMEDVREGSIEMADQTIDLEELDDSYDEDLDQDDGGTDEEQQQDQGMGDMPQAAGPGGQPMDQMNLPGPM